LREINPVATAPGSDFFRRRADMLSLFTRPVSLQRLGLNISGRESNLLQLPFREHLGLIGKPRRVPARTLAISQN
jgi:hypothetical protein